MCPEFLNEISNFDIVCINETKTDSTDDLEIDGFKCFVKHRCELSRFKSGGIAIYVKNDISKYASVIDSASKYVLWLHVSKNVGGLDENLIIGAVNIPPENSKYVSQEYKYCCLIGDFNSRTATNPDFIEFDDRDVNFIDDLNEVDELSILNINRQRISKDTTINNFGRLFLDFCKQLNLFILNGRIGDDKSVGETTCKNVSVIDYCVANTMFLSIVSNFRVLPFSSILSDVHNPIYVHVGLNVSNINAQQVEYQPHDYDQNTVELPKKWNDDMKLHFVNEINER